MIGRPFSIRPSAPLILAIAACVSLSACSGLSSALPHGATQAASQSRQSSGDASNTWSIGAPAPVGQFTGAATALGTKIYLLGGENHMTVLKENDVYDTVANTWTKLARLPTPRAALAAAAVNGLVYAIGGELFDGTPLATVEAYDPASDTWSTKAPLPVAVDSMHATVDNGLIYVVGGLDNNMGHPSNLVQVYDPNANTWAAVKPLNIAKAFSYVGTVGTKIVAAGGFIGNGPSRDNEVYNPTANTWTTKSQAAARYGGCVGAIGGTLYDAGGLEFFPFREASNRLDAYNVAADHWAPLARMVNAVIGPASAVVNGRLYCIGGSPFLGQPIFVTKVQIYQP